MKTSLHRPSKITVTNSVALLLLVGSVGLFLLPACKKVTPCCVYPPDANFQVFVQNDQSQDLLNPQTKNAYDTKGIEVYYLVDGKASLAFQYNLDHPRFWDIDMDSSRNKYFLSARANGNTNALGLSTTLIKWDRNDTDTVVCQMNGPKQNPIQKIWFNDSLVWNGHQPEDTIRTVSVYFAKMFTITK